MRRPVARPVRSGPGAADRALSFSGPSLVASWTFAHVSHNGDVFLRIAAVPRVEALREWSPSVIPSRKRAGMLGPSPKMPELSTRAVICTGARTLASSTKAAESRGTGSAGAGWGSVTFSSRLLSDEAGPSVSARDSGVLSRVNGSRSLSSRVAATEGLAGSSTLVTVQQTS